MFARLCLVCVCALVVCTFAQEAPTDSFDTSAQEKSTKRSNLRQNAEESLNKLQQQINAKKEQATIPMMAPNSHVEWFRNLQQQKKESAAPKTSVPLIAHSPNDISITRPKVILMNPHAVNASGVDGERQDAKALTENPQNGILDQETRQEMAQEEEALDRKAQEEEPLGRKAKEEVVLGRLTRRPGEEVLDRKSQEEEVLDRKSQEEEVLDRKSQEKEVLDRKSQEEEALDRKAQDEEALDSKAQDEEALDRFTQEEEALGIKEERVFLDRKEEEEALDRFTQEEEALDRKEQEEALGRKEQEVETLDRKPQEAQDEAILPSRKTPNGTPRRDSGNGIEETGKKLPSSDQTINVPRLFSVCAALLLVTAL